MNISELFGLKIRGHKDIEFIDIDEQNDTKLFLDPYVIQALQNDFCKKARESIDSFFTEIFRACKARDKIRLRMLCSYSAEPNETNLGMKLISNYGKGATANSLTPLFLNFYKLVRQNPYIETDPLALCIYIRNFAEDKMSDLITNIMRNLLHEFTVEQSRLWGLPLHSVERFLGYYWDCETLSWRKLYGRPFLVSQKNILLVPKSIVRTHYVFNVDRYIRQYVLATLQEEHLRENSDLCSVKVRADGRRALVPPTKKELYERVVRGTVPKDFAFTYSVENKAEEERFIKELHKKINEGFGALTNARLDSLVYSKNSLESA